MPLVPIAGITGAGNPVDTLLLVVSPGVAQSVFSSSSEYDSRYASCIRRRASTENLTIQKSLFIFISIKDTPGICKPSQNTELILLNGRYLLIELQVNKTCYIQLYIKRVAERLITLL
jgi:hypothetical protein